MSDGAKKSFGTIELRRALVTGATGCIGRSLVRRLVAEGCRVNVLVRDPPTFEKLLRDVSREEVRVIHGDLGDSAALDQATQDVDVVFHAAGKAHTVPRNPAEEAEFYRVNVAGTENLLRSCRRSPLRAFVFFSTIAVYGPTDGNVLKDTTPCHPEGFYALSKYQAEMRIVEFFHGTLLRPTILRLCLVHGEGDRGNFSKLIRAIEGGRFMFIGNGESRKSIAYVGNVVEAAVLVARNVAAQGQIFIVADSVCSIRLIAETVARHLGVRPPTLHLPVALARFSSQVLKFTGDRLGFRPPFTTADVRRLTTDVVCDTSKIERLLGFQAKIGLDEGIALTVHSYCHEKATLRDEV